jgi:hypothetical protein
MDMDALSCSSIVGHRQISSPNITSIINAVLTYAGGNTVLTSNTRLAVVEFVSLSVVAGVLDLFNHMVLSQISLVSLTYVGGFLGINRNSLLTCVSVARLSRVQLEIYICENAETLVTPNPAMSMAAFHGLSSVMHKGSSSTFCDYRNGTLECALVVIRVREFCIQKHPLIRVIASRE